MLSVFIHAPHDYCMEQAAKKQNMSPKELEKFVQKTDRRKAEYHKYYTGLNGQMPEIMICVWTAQSSDLNVA